MKEIDSLELKNVVNLRYGVLKLNYKMSQLLLKNLTSFTGLDVSKKTDPIFVDFQVYSNSLLVTERTEKELKTYFDQSYFVRKKVQYSTDLLSSYLMFKKKISQRVIEVGAIVKLILDGSLYTVENLDGLKKIATISKKDKKGNTMLTLKVHLDNLLLAYHSGK